jgi:hypothetical protein
MGTATANRSLDVAKKKGRPSKPSGTGRLVRIDPAIVSMAEYLARAEGTSVADYLSGLLRAPVSRAYAQTLRRLEKEGGAE